MAKSYVLEDKQSITQDINSYSIALIINADKGLRQKIMVFNARYVIIHPNMIFSDGQKCI